MKKIYVIVAALFIVLFSAILYFGIYLAMYSDSYKDIKYDETKLAPAKEIDIERVTMDLAENSIIEGDFKEAMKLYQMAANAGNTEAMVQLARAYKNGQGVEKDYVKTHELCRQAAEKKQSRSYRLLKLYIRNRSRR